ncbi:MAG TPA: hypothetical protein VGL10_03265 [Gammaproteobacteria bacterium]
MKDIEVTALNNIEIELFEVLDKLGKDIESLKKRQAAAHKLRTLSTIEQTLDLCSQVFDRLTDYVAKQFQWVLSESAVVSESKLNSLRTVANRTFNKIHATVNQHLLKTSELVGKPGLHKRYLTESSMYMQKALRQVYRALGDESAEDNDSKMVSVVKTFFGKRKE